MAARIWMLLFILQKANGATDEIPLERLTGEAVVIDVSNNALKNADYLITIADIEAWEKTNGKLQR